MQRTRQGDLNTIDFGVDVPAFADRNLRRAMRASASPRLLGEAFRHMVERYAENRSMADGAGSALQTPVGPAFSVTVSHIPAARTYSESDGIPFEDLGWTQEQFDDAVLRLGHLGDIWDDDELDVYNDFHPG